MNQLQATAIAASAWNRYEQANDRGIVMTPDAVRTQPVHEVVSRLRWYADCGDGAFYNESEINAAIPFFPA